MPEETPDEEEVEDAEVGPSKEDAAAAFLMAAIRSFAMARSDALAAADVAAAEHLKRVDDSSSDSCLGSGGLGGGKGGATCPPELLVVE